MDILEQIVSNKRKETEERKKLFPIALLEQSLYFSAKPVSMKKYVLRDDKAGIIAEFKRKSPSKGPINPYVPVERTTIGYMQAGASGLSVLTDKDFFGGKNEDLITARKFNFCPILRKDFIIDEYQIIEAKSIGADCILLIAAILEPAQIVALANMAHTLGMEVLLEVHEAKELQQNLDAPIDLLGVNNRNLKTFEVSLQTSIDLLPQIPERFIPITESGIKTSADFLMLQNAGFKGFLIGENFMSHGRPEIACKEFVDDIEKSRKSALKSTLA
jgi:indole-3-glycerol phosphate synthase